MKELTFDLRDVTRVTRNLERFANQVPFAMAGALNASAEIGRRTVIEVTWPGHVDVRDPNFMKAALTSKGERATKRRLRVVVYDRIGRANLVMHEVGGTRVPRPAHLAVPVDAVAAKRRSKGIPQALRPRNLANSFVTDGRRPNLHLKQNAVYQRQGSYHKKGSAVSARPGKKRKKAADGRTVKLMYVLKTSVPIKAEVPFHEDFNNAVKRAMPKQFRIAMRNAMKTAWKKK